MNNLNSTLTPNCSSVDVSVIIPCHNAANFIEECIRSVINQNLGNLNVEISFFDDSSTDNSLSIVQSLEIDFSKSGVKLIVEKQQQNLCHYFKPGGVGNAKNNAVKNSSGRFLCFLDADDICFSNRILKQFLVANSCDELTLIGSKFIRSPVESTARYTKWANNLTEKQLYCQAYTSNGPTLVAPTWFCSRKLYDIVGGFDETQRTGFPEDLDFFYKALRLGAKLIKVEEPLVIYRYHSNCASFSVSEDIIFLLRVAEFENDVLENHKVWTSRTFSVWNAGKLGRKFFKSLKLENQSKVVAFCDVDEKKLKRGFYECYEEELLLVEDGSTRKKLKSKFKIPIISVQDVKPPVVICVKMDLTNGDLEKLVAEKNWTEGEDYFYLC